MRKVTAAITGLVLLSFILSIYFYPQVPDQMATHWDSQGEVNGYMSKFWGGTFFMPLLITGGLVILFLVIPKIDPRKENIEMFRKHYEGFRLVLIIFLVLVHLHILLWNTGTQISPNAVIPLGMGGLLFYYAGGVLTENAEQNWFIGIRTPWTLSSENVWKRTNCLGGKLFRIAGITAFSGVFSLNMQSTSSLFLQSL